MNAVIVSPQAKAHKESLASALGKGLAEVGRWTLFVLVSLTDARSEVRKEALRVAPKQWLGWGD